MNTPFILIILDGWGYNKNIKSNAIAQAITPNWDKLWTIYPHTLISSSGTSVGLPDGQVGNSEVGHMIMGAGRIIYQDLTMLNNVISNKSFFSNNVLRDAISKSKTIHILGLLSPGGVHSHENHIFSMIQMAIKKKIVIHPFLDGRDTPPKSSFTSLQRLQDIANRNPNIKIADIMGRYYAMDRDNRLDRTNAACDLLTTNNAKFYASDPLTALQDAYNRGETDEFVQPTKIRNSSIINNNDTVIFMNFRADRARQLCYALLNRVKINLITLTEYDSLLKAVVAFIKQPINNSFSEIIAKNRLRQLHIAETEKYSHVTFFFNNGLEQPLKGEDRILIPSPKVSTYDQCPEMSASAITSTITHAIQNKTHDVIISNFANADMVGHTGSLSATITAIEHIDYCLGTICRFLNKYGGQAIITSDHGNAEVMWNDETRQPHKAHTTNMVPLVYIGKKYVKILPGNFGLKDISPTMLYLLGLQVPKEMTGTSILV